jgi:hypothetical protein
MKPDPILEELWRVKDELARQANYDTHQFFEILRQWETDHPHRGPVVRNARELRDLIAESEEERARSSAVFLKDEPGSTQS